MSDFCGPRKSSCNSPLVDIWTTGVHLFQCMTYKCSRFMTVALWPCLFGDMGYQSKALAILFFQQSLGEIVMAATAVINLLPLRPDPSLLYLAL